MTINEAQKEVMNTNLPNHMNEVIPILQSFLEMSKYDIGEAMIEAYLFGMNDGKRAERERRQHRGEEQS